MNTAIKKIISFAALSVFVLALAPVGHASNVAAGVGDQRKLLVTAYYSPLPDQSYYIRGSYQADVRLNGRGTNGADGTEVYVGMLAAPKSYPFGTRVYIPGLGVGEVHDRGGAILAKRDYDRIDVWMGHGEEGLARALNWGARLVEGEVFWEAHQVEPGLSFNWVDQKLPADTLKHLTQKTLQSPEVFNKPITKKSNQTDLKELQEALTTFGYYHGPINGVYDPATTEAVLAFQLAENVIPTAGSPGAGIFGPKTRATLQEVLKSYNTEVTKEKKRLEENRLMLAAGLGRSATGDDVIALQRMLWELGYYDGELHGKYDSKTIDAVLEFQKSAGILNSEWDYGAGYYGKKTHEALTAAVNEKIRRVTEYPMEMQVWVPAKRPLPRIASLQPPAKNMERQALHFEPGLMNKNFIQEAMSFKNDLDLNDRSDEVLRLQNFLIKQGYLTQGMATGYFGYKTQEAVLKFQMKEGIVQSSDDLGAGRFGPMTRNMANQLL